MNSFAWILLAVACSLQSLESMGTDMPRNCSRPRHSLEYTISRCPRGWVKYKDQKCFKLFDQGRPLTQNEARNFCIVEHGAELPNLHSEEERQLLISIVLMDFPGGILKYFWVGAFKKHTWMWSDHSQFAVTFRNGIFGDIQEPPVDHTCAFLATGQFDDPKSFGNVKTRQQNYQFGSAYINTMCQKYQGDAKYVVLSSSI